MSCDIGSPLVDCYLHCLPGSFPLTGYGLTETCGMAAILVPEFWAYGTVGVPVPSVEIKLQGERAFRYLLPK